ncbi:MAG: CotH kinase family protein [Calditrichota bacterium]
MILRFVLCNLVNFGSGAIYRACINGNPLGRDESRRYLLLAMSNIQKKLLKSLALGWLWLFAFSVPPTEAQELRTYSIICNPEELQFIQQNPWVDREISCSFSFEGRRFDRCRLRLRGEASRYYPKKSYKLNFTAEDRFPGRDKLNLISCWTDSSFAREGLAYETYRRAGLLASQAWFARLFINDVYNGLYLDVEQVDELFLSARGLAPETSIFKAAENGTLLSPDDNVDLMWEKENNPATGLHELRSLIEWLDVTPDHRFFGGLARQFNPEELAQVIAVNALLGNTSAYYHNYYLLHEGGENGLWHILPWDMDYTFYYSANGSQPPYYRSGHQGVYGTNVLIRRCWSDPEMQRLIINQMTDLSQDVFDPDYYAERAGQLDELLTDAVAEDTLKQFTIDDFHASIGRLARGVEARRSHIAYEVQHYALPYKPHTPQLLPDGVWFSWDPAVIADGRDVAYEVRIADDLFISENVRIHRDLRQPGFLTNELNPGAHFVRIYALNPDGEYTMSLEYWQRFVVPENAFGGSTPPARISQPTRWTMEGSPYRLPQGLIINRNGRLDVSPGVRIALGADQSIVVQGSLSFQGQPGRMVIVSRLDPQSAWGPVIFDEAAESSELQYAEISGGSTDSSGVRPGGMIQIEASEVSFNRCQIKCGSFDALKAQASNIQLDGCEIENFGGGLIQTERGSLTLTGSRFFKAFQSGELADLVTVAGNDAAVTIRKCWFYGDGRSGLTLTHARNVNVQQVYFKNISGCGIILDDQSEDIYLANAVVTDGGVGIQINGHSSADIYNVISAFNQTGLWLQDQIGYGRTFVRNSIFWRNSSEIDREVGAILDVSYCLVRGDEDFPGTGNLRQDANFLDQWNRNFYPREDSPLIDAGYGSGHPERDITDGERVDAPNISNNGAGRIPYVDIGVYEFGAVEIPSDREPIPLEYRPVEAYPNPFNSSVSIQFDLTRNTMVALAIYDINGRLVWEQPFGNLPRGRHLIPWAGIDGSGKPIGSGIYLARIQCGGMNRNEIKLVYIK